MEYFDRKLNRLKGYNYSSPGEYFVIINVKDNKKCLGKIKGGKVILNKYGEIVKKQWLWLEKQYFYISLGEFVTMPNHFHGIIGIEDRRLLEILYRNHELSEYDFVTEHRDLSESNVRTTLGLSLRKRHANLLSKTICAFKTTSSKLIHEAGLSEFQWQRSFYDHVIRNDEDLDRIRRYIRENPLALRLKNNPK